MAPGSGDPSIAQADGGGGASNRVARGPVFR